MHKALEAFVTMYPLKKKNYCGIAGSHETIHVIEFVLYFFFFFFDNMGLVA